VIGAILAISASIQTSRNHRRTCGRILDSRSAKAVSWRRLADLDAQPFSAGDPGAKASELTAQLFLGITAGVLL